MHNLHPLLPLAAVLILPVVIFYPLSPEITQQVPGNRQILPGSMWLSLSTSAVSGTNETINVLSLMVI